MRTSELDLDRCSSPDVRIKPVHSTRLYLTPVTLSNLNKPVDSYLQAEIMRVSSGTSMVQGYMNSSVLI